MGKLEDCRIQPPACVLLSTAARLASCHSKAIDGSGREAGLYSYTCRTSTITRGLNTPPRVVTGAMRHVDAVERRFLPVADFAFTAVQYNGMLSLSVRWLLSIFFSTKESPPPARRGVQLPVALRKSRLPQLSRTGPGSQRASSAEDFLSSHQSLFLEGLAKIFDLPNTHNIQLVYQEAVCPVAPRDRACTFNLQRAAWLSSS